MNTPPFLLAGVCAAWALQSGQWLVALLAALAIEGARLVPLRWNLAQAHFNRLADFCSVLIVVLAGFLYITFGNPRAILLLFQWLPLALLPLALAQAWGSLPRIGVAAFVWNLRRDPDGQRYALNLGYPYCLVWLIAAGAANERGPAFYVTLVLLGGWALWMVRPARAQPAVWLGLFAVAAGLGYGGQHGLTRAQSWLEEAVPEWLIASGSRTDPYRSRTDLGHIGTLKLDEAIVLRVGAGAGVGAPLLLHRSSYNAYFGGTWFARNAPLAGRQPDAAGRWELAGAAAASGSVVVHDYSPRGDPVLSLPAQAVRITGLTAAEVRTNRLGTIQAVRPPGHFSYTVALGAGHPQEAGPDEDDLRLPRAERTMLEELVRELGLAGMSAAEAVAAVRAFFGRGFGYSFYQPGGAGERSPIEHFLLRTRAGHCEYFATATALLLRAGGVPARYATGFSMQEWSGLQDAWLVRERHAHAWVRAHVDGRWIDVDTTPGVWAAVEAAAAPWWAPATDLYSWLRFRVALFAAGAREVEDGTALWTGVVLLLGAWLGWRLYRQRRLLVYGAGGRAAPAGGMIVPGADSEFYAIEQALARHGCPRARGETVSAWLARSETLRPGAADWAALRELVWLHYRLRFDPAGLPSIERERLRNGAQAWLARHESLRA